MKQTTWTGQTSLSNNPKITLIVGKLSLVDRVKVFLGFRLYTHIILSDEEAAYLFRLTKDYFVAGILDYPPLPKKKFNSKKFKKVAKEVAVILKEEGRA